MKWVKFYVITIIFACTCTIVLAQEKRETEEKFQPHHMLAAVISHAHVFEGRNAEGKRSVLSLPSFGIDYTYQFHPKWGLGIHTDIIIEEFKVAKNLEPGGAGEVVERSFPVAPALMGIYKPNKHWAFLLGAGVEFERDENYFLNRVGVEYSAELPKSWEVFGSLGYDFKWNAYDTWVLGLGIAKSFGKHKK